MGRRIKQEVVTDDDIKVLYPVKSRPPSAPPNKDDSEDDKYVEVHDGPKVCDIPLTNNQIKLNDLLLFFAGVDGLKFTVENGIPKILRLVEGYFKPPSTGWESGKVEVARRNIPNTIDTNSIVNQRSEGGSLPDSRYSSPLMSSAQDYTGQSEHSIRTNRSEEASSFASYPVVSGNVLFEAPVQNMLPDPPLPVHSHVFTAAIPFEVVAQPPMMNDVGNNGGFENVEGSQNINLESNNSGGESWRNLGTAAPKGPPFAPRPPLDETALSGLFDGPSLVSFTHDPHGRERRKNRTDDGFTKKHADHSESPKMVNSAPETPILPDVLRGSSRASSHCPEVRSSDPEPEIGNSEKSKRKSKKPPKDETFSDSADEFPKETLSRSKLNTKLEDIKSRVSKLLKKKPEWKKVLNFDLDNINLEMLEICERCVEQLEKKLRQEKDLNSSRENDENSTKSDPRGKRQRSDSMNDRNIPTKRSRNDSVNDRNIPTKHSRNDTKDNGNQHESNHGDDRGINFDRIEKRDYRLRSDEPTKEALMKHFGKSYEKILKSPEFQQPGNVYKIDENFERFKEKFFTVLRRSILQFGTFKAGFLWKLYEIIQSNQKVGRLVDGSHETCNICRRKFVFTMKHLFDSRHIKLYQKKWKVDPPHIVEIFKHIQSENVKICKPVRNFK